MLIQHDTSTGIRHFAAEVRALTLDEALTLTHKFVAGGPAKLERATRAFAGQEDRSNSLASVYQVLQ